MTMDYAHLPVLVDLSDKQACTNLDMMAPYVDGVIVKMGEANPADPANPKYDPSFHVHINNAYYAQPKRLPAGAYYVLNTNMWQNVTLSALQTMKRTENPNYKFIYDTLQNKAVNFIGLTLQYSTKADNTASTWIIQDLDTLYRNLKEGMKAGEIPTMPILICTNEKFVDTYLVSANFYTWIQQHETSTVDVTKNDIQVWTQDYSHMAYRQDSWMNLRKYMPPADAKPPYLNGIPNWFLWQIGSTLFPKDVFGSMMYFSLNISFVTLERLYAWMNYIPGTGSIPTTHDCQTGYHWDDTQSKCVADSVPTPIPVPTDITDLYKKNAMVADALSAAYSLIAKIWRGQS